MEEGDDYTDYFDCAGATAPAPPGLDAPNGESGGASTPPGLEVPNTPSVPSVPQVPVQYWRNVVYSAVQLQGPQRPWISILDIYTASEAVEMCNRLASSGHTAFVTPKALVTAAKSDSRLETRELEDGSWQCRDRETHGRRLSRAISGVLRYDVQDWMSLSALQPLVAARLNRPVTLGSIFVGVAGDDRRFQLQQWEGKWWARATYRH